uniref:HECT-type E3 ubiquitin transferase n=1 Tax=Trypanosoma vivax (strain Y486) TaxID=1055687 RepID=G0U8U6_TRYVY
MEQFFSRLMMDSVGPIAHRRELKEITSARESLEADDEGQQIDGLAGLCNLLNMATPLTISAIRPSVFVPLLLNCMRKEHNIDLVLLAARALTYMVDAISSTVFVVVSEGGVEVLLTYLRDVKDIELLEQCMMCLEKITQNTTCASVVLEKGGVSALLMFVDFLSSASQRKAWSSVVAMCRRVSVINYQHNNKAMRHCSNFLLAGQHITTWAVNLAMDCNFLFSTSTRKYLFDVSFCGTQRSVVQMQENMDKYGIRDSLSAERQQNRIFRLHKEKKRVWRDKALACAMAIMGKKRMSGSVVLEFEYYNENGSGSGPTMEFYTLVSNELREIKLKLWRLSDEAPNDKYYQPHNGVYPQPVPESSPLLEKMESYFFFLGRFMARALLDKRILSIPLSNVVHKTLRGDSCGVYDLIDIDESLGKTILAFVQAARNGSDVVVMPHSTSACRVEDLGLDFTLPGKEFVELREGGATIPLIASNLADYCDLVTEYLLDKGVRRFVCALRRGFNDYIPLCALRMLSVSELREILNGHNKLVKIEDLEAHCQADHGYTMSCRHVRQLFEIIASFNEEEQNAFFHFLTGSSHLPVGGLASLQPKFTIVRKTSSDDKVREQDQLPSAMTCQNYLKLPAYDSKEQMEQKLRLALSEGCGAFLLT